MQLDDAVGGRKSAVEAGFEPPVEQQAQRRDDIDWQPQGS